MVNPQLFFDALKNKGAGLFTGVPDSLLSSFCAYIQDNLTSDAHIIAANEGNAIALGIGHYLATKKIPVVYMQNSGLGNAINPLTSLADKQVYQIPMLLIIGWRGEPNFHDEPQHVKQGRITLKQLEILEIPYWILEADSSVEVLLEDIFESLTRTNAPVALVVKQKVFETYVPLSQKEWNYSLSRETALAHILSLIDVTALVISTTGKTSRELFELRLTRKEAQHDFLTVGGMGHTSSIALGVALGQPNRQVICLDGDGSAIMHLGALPIIGSIKPKNFVHILLNNAAHESVGGQPTIADKMNFEFIAKGCGYEAYFCVINEIELKEQWSKIKHCNGAVLVEIKIKTGSRSDLGRPTRTPLENKDAFMVHAND